MIILLTILLYFDINYLKNRKLKYSIITIINSIILYLIPVLLFLFNKYQIERKMQEFDLNNDGFFNSNEMTSELNSLQMEYISDAGGNLFILYGLPVCILLSIILTIIHKTINNQ